MGSLNNLLKRVSSSVLLLLPDSYKVLHNFTRVDGSGIVVDYHEYSIDVGIAAKFDCFLDVLSTAEGFAGDIGEPYSSYLFFGDREYDLAVLGK